MTRSCERCGAPFNAKRKDARYCTESCAKQKPCLRCGGYKGKNITRGKRYCPPCQAIVDSKDHTRDLERHRMRAEQLASGKKIRRRNDAPDGEKWCAHCQRFLPLSSFGTTTRQGQTRPTAYCIPCAKDYAHARLIARQYGITADRYLELLQLQDGRCAICLTRPRNRRLAVDHDHNTGEIRGLLCTRCNHGILGKAHDSVTLLTRAIAYLTEPPARTGRPVTDHTLEQQDLEFTHEELPQLTDGHVARHPGRDLVAVTAPTFLALTEAAGYPLTIGDTVHLPPEQTLTSAALVELLKSAGY